MLFSYAALKKPYLSYHIVMSLNTALNELLSQIKQLRESKQVSTSELEKKLILGPGWIEEFEAGKTIPRLDVFLSILNELNVTPSEVDFSRAREIEFARNLQAEDVGADLLIAFPYGKYEAKYLLKGAKEAEFEQVLSALRNGLAAVQGEDEETATQIKANAVANTFLKAISLWPEANPSDVWWFIVYRAFLDPYNHPASWAKLNLDQSWKRTGGWALEKILVQHYKDALREIGIKLFIADNETKRNLLAQISTVNRIEADKADVLLTTETKDGERLFGVIHVKASFAERRTDDVPLSRDLIEAGYYSPLWTMDCKSSPSSKPLNKGELGAVKDGATDRRSAKRKDIEDDGFFTHCFSYNSNTNPTPIGQNAKSAITVCNFKQIKDDFFTKTVAARDKFLKLNQL